MSLLDEESNGTAPPEAESGEGAAENRRLVAAIRPESDCAELEILVASEGSIHGNLENRMAYLGEEQALEDERELSVRILRHYASSVNHRKYHGLDIITCRVDK